MAKQYDHKLKLLYLMQYLLEQSDEQHPISADQIKSFLSQRDISVERKTIYADIEALRLFGLDIIMTKSKPSGYYVASRTFETPELKLLVDSVQSSQFITEKKTAELIKKLESLSSIYEARLMRRNVYVKNRVKHMNESIYYNVDQIHDGITENKRICFRYFEFTTAKQKQYRHNGKAYCISPFALTWDNENYYMIGYDSDAGIIKHYRVDRMESISVSDIERDGQEAFERHDMGLYTKQSFAMFGGKTERVEIEFDNHLAGVVMDRFGKDTVFIKSDDAHFRIRVEVMVSPQFYAWVFGLCPGARITSPQEVADGMKSQLEAALQMS